MTTWPSKRTATRSGVRADLPLDQAVHRRHAIDRLDGPDDMASSASPLARRTRSAPRRSSRSGRRSPLRGRSTGAGPCARSVGASKRSVAVLEAHRPRHRRGRPSRERSNWAAPRSISISVDLGAVELGRRRSGAFWTLRKTWNSGDRLRSRTGWSSLTSVANGDVLVGVGVERDVAGPVEELGEGLVAVDVDPHDERVDERRRSGPRSPASCGWRSGSPRTMSSAPL